MKTIYAYPRFRAATDALWLALCWLIRRHTPAWVSLVTLAVSACVVQPAPVTPPPPATTMLRTEACQEQADAWCARAGFDTPACRSAYVHECEPLGPDGVVPLPAENACMQAIADNPTPAMEPGACQATWKGV